MKPAPKPTKTAAAPTGAGEFTTEAEAKGRCPTDTVVWVNLKSHKYHYAGHKSYGTTKQGAYMCEADATAAGDVAARGEKPKSSSIAFAGGRRRRLAGLERAGSIAWGAVHARELLPSHRRSQAPARPRHLCLVPDARSRA